MSTKSSQELFNRALHVMPGGVNSPVRAWNSVGGIPLHIRKGIGNRIITSENSELIDFCGSWGPLILGHAYPDVIETVMRVVQDGLTFGATTRLEIEMAERLCELIPPIEMVRLVNSGTEATMTALRLARGYTKRLKILKFDGCYHGHSDYLLVSAGSGLLTGGIASSAGVSDRVAEEVLVAPYNDLEAVRSIIEAHGDDIAAVIVEPVAGNMGLIKPAQGFLEGLRKLTHSCGALLIFDEVITAFRLAPTSFGNVCGVHPDLTCLGKIIGGGMPIGAIGGSKKIMEFLAPLGTVYQAGTLSGNPISMAAGIATLKVLKEKDPYADIEKKCEALVRGIAESGEYKDGMFHCEHLGGMFTIFFTSPPVNNLKQAKESHTGRYAEFFHHMLSRNFYLPPSQFEVCFISAAHSMHDVARFIDAVCDFHPS